MSHKSPKVSIVIPIYNVEKYLRSCIDSIIGQSFQDFELILVNDGSIDSSLEICREYEQRDKRIKVINKKNGGLSSARNAGLSVAKGNYISFIDPDDCINKEYFNILVNEAEENNCDVVVCGYKTVPNNIEIIPSYKLNTVLKGTNFILSSDSVHSKNELCFVWRYFYKLELIRKNKIFFNEKVYIGEDVIFNLEVLVNCQRVMAISDILYYYTINNPNSLMRNTFKPNLEYSLLEQYRIRNYLSEKYQLLKDKNYKMDMARYYVDNIYNLVINNLVENRNFNLDSDIKRITEYDMFQENIKRLGFRYKCNNYKEYVYYIARKFRIYSIVKHGIKRRVLIRDVYE